MAQYTKCWDGCQAKTAVGKDSRGDICWCSKKNCVVDPNIGCDNPVIIR